MQCEYLKVFHTIFKRKSSITLYIFIIRLFKKLRIEKHHIKFFTQILKKISQNSKKISDNSFKNLLQNLYHDKKHIIEEKLKMKTQFSCLYKLSC